MSITLTPLHAALAGALGHELTPEAAAQIVLAAAQTFSSPGNGPALQETQVQPEAHAGWVIQRESFAKNIEELQPLHAQHWAETEGYRSSEVDLAPMYGNYMAREQRGEQALITARNASGRLAGCLLLRLVVSEHSSSWVAIEDQLFVAHWARGAWLGARMLRHADRVLASMGVREFRAKAKHSNRARSLFEREGFKAVATELVKFI